MCGAPTGCTLLYQPIMPLEGGATGVPRVEALLRMSETGGELILPGEEAAMRQHTRQKERDVPRDHHEKEDRNQPVRPYDLV